MNATTASEIEPKDTLANFIVENLDSIKAGTAVYNGQRITLDTELVRYHTCYSFIFLFMRQASPLFLKWLCFSAF